MLHRRENAFAFGHFAQLVVVALNHVRGVYNLADLRRVAKSIVQNHKGKISADRCINTRSLLKYYCQLIGDKH